MGFHMPHATATGFEYNGVYFDESTVHIFAGLCAVDTPENVEEMFRACRDNGLVTSRMGAFKVNSIISCKCLYCLTNCFCCCCCFFA